MFHTTSIRSWLRLFPAAAAELGKNDPLRMAAATAFFTSFALPPILIILTQLLSLLLDPDRAGREVVESLQRVVGPRGSEQVMDTLRAVREFRGSGWVMAGGFLFLVFVATTLFKVVKNSINQIWKIRVAPHRKLFMRMRTRTRSVGVIVVAALLFLVGLVAEAGQTILGRYIAGYSLQLAVGVYAFLGHLISLVMITLWFALLFRFLPDGRPGWGAVWRGAAVTGLLFSGGKYLVRWLLGFSNLNSLYGTSGSIMLLLLFVFYSSFILYFGAAFTKMVSLHLKRPIRPLPYAEHYRLASSE